MTREELLRSPEYWITHIQNDLFNIIREYLEKNDLKQKDFAERLNVSKGYISQVLNGDFDHKLSKMVELSLAAGKAVTVKFNDIEKVIEDDRNDKFSITTETKPVVFMVSDQNGLRSATRNAFIVAEQNATSAEHYSLLGGSHYQIDSNF